MNRVEVEIPSLRANGSSMSNNAISWIRDKVTELMLAEFGEVTQTEGTRLTGSTPQDQSPVTIMTVTLFELKPSEKSWAARLGAIKDAIIAETGGDSIRVTMYAVEGETI
jgi:hypothetical protein